MKLVIINGKKVMVSTVLVILMIVLVFLESYFHDNLKQTAWIQNNITSLNEYMVEDGKIIYKLPSTWECKESEKVYGSAIYHNDFYDNKTKLSGYIEVKEKNEELVDVVKSIVNDKKENIKYNYHPVKVNSNEGFLLTYSIKSIDNENLSVYEYLVENKEVQIKMSFFVRKNEFRNNMPRIFNGIIETITISESQSLNK